MCLAIPVKLIKKNGIKGVVESGGVKINADLRLLDDIKVGDYIILHAGFAIQKLDEKDAKETLELFRQIASAI